ncbi:MAG: pYEATS domain-containing protein [Gemmatimonadaceae bacterium]
MNANDAGRPAWRRWGIPIGSAFTIVAGALAIALISREAIREAARVKLSWWLPATAIATVLAAFALGILLSRRALKQVIGRQPDKPLATLTALLVVGFTMAFWYGWTTPPGGPFMALLLTGTMAAAMSVGALVGFLFGIPRFDYSGRGAASANATPSTSHVSSTALSNSPRARYRPSSNLDDVADWLTKIIVGLSLTQLLNVGTGLRSITVWVLTPCGAECLRQQGFLSGLIVSGVIGGFLFAYVWTRLHYGLLAARADVDTEKLLIEEALTHGIGKQSTVRSLLSSYPVDSEQAAQLREQLQVVTDDPNKGRFGGRPSNNDRSLRATITPSESAADLFIVRLEVVSTLATKPLRGFVTFHLHPTFREPVVTRPVENGSAILTVLSYGAFTVGAEADEGRTRLELDLAANPDAPEDFKSR